MFTPEKYFFDVKEILPREGQRVIAYNNELDNFVFAIFKNGKFYENDYELINITRWKETNIILDKD